MREYSGSDGDTRNTHVSRNIPKPSNLSVRDASLAVVPDKGGRMNKDEPIFPNTGPGSARPLVTQKARPSP